MCSSQGICGNNGRSNRSSSSRSSGSGAHYALCALGVGLIALGIVMIVWTVIPGGDSGASPKPSSNSTGPNNNVAMVLVGVGAVMLILAIGLGLKSKKRAQDRRSEPYSTNTETDSDPTTYNVPSYEEVVSSSEYPVRQSNLRQSTSHLPSYEDIIAAVENEGTEPANNTTDDTPVNDQPAAAEPPSEPAGLTSNPSMPTRSASRASRLLRPLRVRRIKSDKLHLKDFRLQIRTPTQNPVTIEPITPPPQYEDKMPEFK
uniref:Transmembrane protein 51b n=1 Tax=Oreochromis niloticus TaxID=8128 RepID=A0A669CIX0_ORENI